MTASVSQTVTSVLIVLVVSFSSMPVLSDEPADKDKKPPDKKDAIVAGKAEVLRATPKRFATLTAVHPASQRVTLLIEGENLPKVWGLRPDAEVKISGWWGRLDQFQLGDRVWAWFHLDRDKQPDSVLMLADELSEQDIHGPGVTVEAIKEGELTVKPVQGSSRSLKLSAKEICRGSEKVRILQRRGQFMTM